MMRSDSCRSELQCSGRESTLAPWHGVVDALLLLLAAPLQWLLNLLNPDALLAIPLVRSVATLVLGPKCRPFLARSLVPVHKSTAALDSLKYPLSQDSRQALMISSQHAGLWQESAHYGRHSVALPELGRILLLAAGASRLCVEAIVSALARECGASLLPVDLNFLETLTTAALGTQPKRPEAQEGGFMALLVSAVWSGGKHAFALDIVRAFCKRACANGPVILYISDVDETACGTSERFHAFLESWGDQYGPISTEQLLQQDDDWGPLLIVAASRVGEEDIMEDHQKDVSALGVLKEDTFLQRAAAALGLSIFPLEWLSRSRSKPPDVGAMLQQLFTTTVRLEPLGEGPLLARWRRLQREDMEDEQSLVNWARLQGLAVVRDILCPPRHSSLYKHRILERSEWAKVLAWALAAHFEGQRAQCAAKEAWEMDDDDSWDGRRSSICGETGLLLLTEGELKYGVRMLEATSMNHRTSVKPSNIYEQQLMSDVLHDDDLGQRSLSSFASIGAMDEPKAALREAVELPMRFPELFRGSSLLQPVKGVLLFGPPGTGKSSLARAVAAECGATFINVQMSTVASKWLGEGVRYIRALFSLAAKHSPAVIFVDEVDALLGRRNSHTEHEALREMKNEFMAHWDGIRATAKGERVMVLAATNRPQDLDEAALRRFAKRIFCGLPNQNERLQILRVLLAEESVSDDVDLNKLAERTNRYSGSDLRNLCMAAAMWPVRELASTLQERKDSQDGVSTSAAGAREPSTSSPPHWQLEGLEWSPKLRPIMQEDFDAALRQVNPSTNEDSSSMTALQEWNSRYGDNSDQSKREVPSYFM